MVSRGTHSQPRPNVQTWKSLEQHCWTVLCCSILRKTASTTTDLKQLNLTAQYIVKDVSFKRVLLVLVFFPHCIDQTDVCWPQLCRCILHLHLSSECPAWNLLPRSWRVLLLLHLPYYVIKVCDLWKLQPLKTRKSKSLWFDMFLSKLIFKGFQLKFFMEKNRIA